ncbi:MAG: hypothetical protein AB7S38_32790 [Vulcanimicrobiota bacterium]
MKTLALVALCVLLSVGGQLCLKSGASGKQLANNPLGLSAWWSVLSDPVVIAGLTMWTLSAVFWIYVLAQTDLSLAYTLYGVTYILTPLLGVWLFAEKMGPLRLVGAGLVAVGVMVTLAGRLLETQGG